MKWWKYGLKHYIENAYRKTKREKITDIIHSILQGVHKVSVHRG